MAKGMRVKLNYEIGRDPDTGVEVTRLTPPEVTCHRNYFYQKCFFNDGSHLLFAGAFDGHWNYYLLDLQNAEAVQLTEGAGDNTFGGFLSPDDRAFYYVKNDRTLLEVDLETRAEREVYRVPDECGPLWKKSWKICQSFSGVQSRFAISMPTRLVQSLFATQVP